MVHSANWILFGAIMSLLACHNLNMNAMEKITVEDHLKCSDWKRRGLCPPIGLE